jgi:cobalt-zinc-cadmium efflux system outer membrane protein
MLPNPFGGYSGQQVGSGGRAEQPGVYFGQDIIRGGKLRLNREVAAQEVSRAEQDLSAQELRVRTDVRIAFYQILIAQRQLTLSDALTDIAAKSVETADALFKAKEVSRSDTLLAEIELENARIINRNSRNRYVAAWQTLSTVVGIPELAPQFWTYTLYRLDPGGVLTTVLPERTISTGSVGLNLAISGFLP